MFGSAYAVVGRLRGDGENLYAKGYLKAMPASRRHDKEVTGL